MTSSRNLGSFTPGPISALPSPTRGGRRMRESRKYGVVRGALSNERPYRDHHCPGRGTSASDSEILCWLLQRHRNASVFEQGCAGLSLGTARRCHSFTCHPGRTSSPLRSDLGFSVHTTTLRVQESLGVPGEPLGSLGRPLSRTPASM
jgi:hypothetical protein